MGSNGKEKSARNARKHRNPKPPPSSSSSSDLVSAAGNITPSGHAEPLPDLNLPAPNPSYSFDDSGWGYCTEEQLKELLLKNLDLVYREALSRLLSLGYDEPLALRALLSNGFCYGSSDALSNILHNSITYIKADDATPGYADFPASFSDLRLLQEYSLSGLVCLLRQVRPQLTRGNAMYCLLMAGLHFGRATEIEIPALNAPPGYYIVRDPERVTLSTAIPCSKSDEDSPSLPSDSFSSSSDVVASVMKSLESMSIKEEGEGEGEGEKPDEEKRMRVLSLIRQIESLETQVKERKEWAQQKAMQAAKKVSKDLMELQVLRMEREENRRVKSDNQAVTVDETMMKRLSETESALKKASGQVDRANAVVSRLQAENAEIRAEMEASKLSASESERTFLEVAKRENRCLKRLSAWEKQREKLQGDVTEEKKRVMELQCQIHEVTEAKKEAEAKWKDEIKAKEQAITLVGDEHRAKEAAEASIKRKHEGLQRKIQVDFERYKDDIHRLEEELSRLRAGTGSAEAKPKPAKSSNTRNAQGLKESEDLRTKVNKSRECVMCRNDEVNVVFLPCAHQVLCAGCSEEQEMKAKSACPCCGARIDQRIRVFGAAC